jgi:hypothetical protein
MVAVLLRHYIGRLDVLDIASVPADPSRLPRIGIALGGPKAVPGELTQARDEA